MELQASVTKTSSGIKATTELDPVAMIPVPPEPPLWPVLAGAGAAGLWAGLWLTEAGMGWLAQALPTLPKDWALLWAEWPVRLLLFGGGLAVIVAFVAVARRPTPATVSNVEPAPEPVVPTAAPRVVPAVAEAPEWVGEVVPVIGHAAGSLELYGDEGYSDLLMVDNISPLKVRKLEGIGIRSRSDLLRAGRSQLGRQDIARRTGIGVRQLTDWINKADLLRIEGPPPLNMAAIRLLEVAGIETVADLAGARPEAIHRKLVEYGKRQGPDLRLPSIADVTVWVEVAGSLV